MSTFLALWFSILIVWFLLIECGAFCNQRASILLTEAKRILDTRPLDEAALLAQMTLVDTWMARDLYLLRIASLGLFRVPR